MFEQTDELDEDAVVLANPRISHRAHWSFRTTFFKLVLSAVSVGFVSLFPASANLQDINVSPAQIVIHTRGGPTTFIVRGRGIDRVQTFEFRAEGSRKPVPGLSIARIANGEDKVAFAIKAAPKSRSGAYRVAIFGDGDILGTLKLIVSHNFQNDQPVIIHEVVAASSGYVIVGDNFLNPDGSVPADMRIVENDEVLSGESITSIASQRIDVRNRWTQGQVKVQVSHEGGQRTINVEHTRPEIDAVVLTDEGYTLHGRNFLPQDGSPVSTLVDDSESDVSNCFTAVSSTEIEITATNCAPSIMRVGTHSHQVTVGGVKSRPFDQDHLSPTLNEIETTRDGYRLKGSFGLEAERVRVFQRNGGELVAGEGDQEDVEVAFDLVNPTTLYVSQVPALATLIHTVRIDQRSSGSRTKTHVFPPILGNIEFGEGFWTVSGVHLKDSSTNSWEYWIDGKLYETLPHPIDTGFPKVSVSPDGQHIHVNDILSEGSHHHMIRKGQSGEVISSDIRTVDHPVVDFSNIGPFELQSSTTFAMGGSQISLEFLPAPNQKLVKFITLTTQSSILEAGGFNSDIAYSPAEVFVDVDLSGGASFGPLTFDATLGPFSAQKQVYVLPEVPPRATSVIGQRVLGTMYVTGGDVLTINTIGPFEFANVTIEAHSKSHRLTRVLPDEFGRLSVEIPDLDGTESAETSFTIDMMGESAGFPTLDENAAPGVKFGSSRFEENIQYINRPAFSSCGHEVPENFATGNLLFGRKIIPGIDFVIHGKDLLLPFEQSPGALTKARLRHTNVQAMTLAQLDSVSSTPLEILEVSTQNKLTVQLPALSVEPAAPGRLHVVQRQRLSRSTPAGYDGPLPSLSNDCTPSVDRPTTFGRPVPDTLVTSDAETIEIRGRYLGWLATRAILNGLVGQVVSRNRDSIVLSFPPGGRSGEIVIQTQAGNAVNRDGPLILTVQDS